MVGWARSTSGGVCGTLTRLGSSQGLLYIDEGGLRYSDYSLCPYTVLTIQYSVLPVAIYIVRTLRSTSLDKITPLNIES